MLPLFRFFGCLPIYNLLKPLTIYRYIIYYIFIKLKFKTLTVR
ncbi:hypothetical protein HMPREF1140_1215 [Lachnoanaerobaculum sp. ICM7]|nr:hypothetical protein HMPREF1140_1215 [Lachnoanaerobaculum sp. ICM7]